LLSPVLINHTVFGVGINYPTPDRLVLVSITVEKSSGIGVVPIGLSFADFQTAEELEHANFDLIVTQNDKTVLSKTGEYLQEGKAQFYTIPLRNDDPLNIKIVLLGFGLPDDEDNWTGTKGQTIQYPIVPEVVITEQIPTEPESVETEEEPITEMETEEEPITEMETEEESPSEEVKTALEDTMQTGETEEGGGCLIATATYGTEMAPQVQLLRELRDNKILKTASGSSFMGAFNTIYYSFSPNIADLERENFIFREAVKIAITPLLTSLSILNYVDIDSEEKMLSYGIGIILLNVGMYVVAPTAIIYRIKK